MRKFLMAAFSIALVSASTNAFAQEKAANDHAAIRSTIERSAVAWATAINSGKYADVAALYAADAMLLPPEAAIVKGNAAIKEFWAGTAAIKLTDAKLTVEDVEVHGDIAIERGAYSLKVTPPAASAPVEDNGKYLVIWKKQGDGSWKIHRDMWSSNIPRQ